MENIRDYAALPHEYLEEMSALNDAEFGRLVRSLLEYSREGTPIALCGNERFYAVRVMTREDRYQESYKKQNAARSSAGQAGANARWNRDANACEEMPKHAKACERMPEDGKNGNTETETETKTETKEKRESARARGAYGWVKLTDRQYDRLLEDLGKEEALRCIAYVDESAQSSGNRNQWSDWNLVLRRCSRDGWGLDNRNAGRPNKILTASAYRASQAGAAPLDMDAFDALADRI